MRYSNWVLGSFLFQSLIFSFTQSARASTRTLSLPGEARNIQIVSLQPAQILKGLREVKNPDCDASASDRLIPCMKIISQPIYESGIQLEISYDDARGQGAGDSVVGFDKRDFTSEQLAKIESLTARESVDYAKQIIKLDLKTSIVAKNARDEEKSQFCDYAPDPDQDAKSDPSCGKKVVEKRVAETIQILSATPSNR